MTQKATLLILFLILFSCKTETSSTDEIDSYAWLIGKWESKSKEGFLEETWKSANDSTFEGTSYFIKAKDTLHHETMILQKVNDKIIYKATIKGENNDESVSFPLSISKEKNVTFENPKHNYPQKLQYQLINDSILTAKISGTFEGKPLTETFTLKKDK